ncbi:MAG TPA: hypothetical protein VGF16_12310 [Bryobacteraceae bacterium]
MERIAQLGGSVARITVSARAVVDYQTGEACSPDFSLLGALQTPDLVRALSNRQISTFIFTLYDDLTFGCDSQRYFDPSFYSPENTAALVGEYADLTLFLVRNYPDKRFILDNWESDNAIFCGAAYSYATDPQVRTRCDSNYPAWFGVASPAEGLRGLRLWLEARAAGVQEGLRLAAAQGLPGGSVQLAAEMNIVRALRDHGLPSVLYDVLPGLAVDYVSYSAYESINGPNPVAQLLADLDTIRSVSGLPVIIGEFGFPRAARPDAVTVNNTVVNAAAAWGVDYAVAWNLFDQSPTEDFGLFDLDGQPTPLAPYFFQLFHAAAAPHPTRGRLINMR